MESAIKIVEIILYACVVLLPVTSLLLIRVVKKVNLKIIEQAVTNPIIPNFDLCFFSELQKEYKRITGQSLLPITNKLALYFGIGGLFLLFALVIVSEITRY